MIETFTDYLLIALAVAFVVLVAVAWVLDQNLDAGYKPSKPSDQARRDVAKLMREANQ